MKDAAPERDPVADVEKAIGMGRFLMDSSRKQNAEWSKREGKPSKITEADYIRGENDVAALALRYWGYGPTKAKRMVLEYREAKR